MPSHELIKQLSKLLQSCMNVDSHRYKRQLDRLRSDYKKGKDPAQQLATLAAKIDLSIAKRSATTFESGIGSINSHSHLPIIPTIIIGHN